jgi:hypothetical protein
MGVTYGLLDGKSVGILYTIKAYRILCMWFLLFLMDKVYQTEYVNKVFVQDGRAPTLMYWPLVLIASESATFLLAFALILIFERRFKNVQNTFIVDDTLLVQIMMDYVMTTLVMMLVGFTVVFAVMNCSRVRYGHDGLRGIRSASRLMFYLNAVVLTLPMFLAY